MSVWRSFGSCSMLEMLIKKIHVCLVRRKMQLDSSRRDWSLMANVMRYLRYITMSNYYRAIKWLESTEKLLKQNSEKADADKNAINQYVGKGYAMEFQEEDDHNRIVQNLPYHALFRKDRKMTKCCVWCNDPCTQSDPVLQPDRVSVQLCFRLHKIALMADIEKKRVASDQGLWQGQDVLRCCSDTLRATNRLKCTGVKGWHLVLIVLRS